MFKHRDAEAQRSIFSANLLYVKERAQRGGVAALRTRRFCHTGSSDEATDSVYSPVVGNQWRDFKKLRVSVSLCLIINCPFVV